MKTKRMSWLLLFILAVLMTACDNDAPYYGEGYDSEFNLLYSNKTFTQADAGSLVLNYSGSPLYNKEAYFEMSDATHAKIKLFGILPAEQEALVESVSLASSKDGYTFSTSATSAKGTTFTLDGSVKKGELTLNLTDVKIPANPLSAKGTFPIEHTVNVSAPEYDPDGLILRGSQSIFLSWKVLSEGEEDNFLHILNPFETDLSALAQSLIAQLIYLVLQDVTFLPDGNIVANYAPMRDDVDITSLIFSMVTEDMRGEMTQSPLNLCRYFVEGNTVYIQPDLTMILQAIEMNKTKSSGTTKTDFDLQSILALLPTVNTWMNEGIKFNLIEHNPEEPFIIPLSLGQFQYMYYFDASYRLALDQNELMTLIPVIPTILELLVGDLNGLIYDVPILGSIDVGEILTEMLERMQLTSSIEVGLLLK